MITEIVHTNITLWAIGDLDWDCGFSYLLHIYIVQRKYRKVLHHFNSHKLARRMSYRHIYFREFFQNYRKTYLAYDLFGFDNNKHIKEELSNLVQSIESYARTYIFVIAFYLNTFTCLTGSFCF